MILWYYYVKKGRGFNMKILTVLFEVIFVLSVLIILLTYFDIKIAEDLRLWAYLLGGISFLISFILRKFINTQELDNKNI